jgi:4-amino-4-deoxy-L-arabinose transferase-like glycosyltransferase
MTQFLHQTRPSAIQHGHPKRSRHLLRHPHIRSFRPSVRPLVLRGHNIEPRDRFLTSRDRLLLDVLLALLFFALSLAINLGALPTTPTHPDETRWMNRAYYVRDLADPFGPTWQDYVTTRGQPPLGSIVMGIGLAIQGRDLDATGVWDFAYGSDWNERAGAVPAEEDRHAARRTNAVIGAMVAGLAFVLGRLLTNRVGGGIAAGFVAFHPLHITLSTQALSDQTLALLLMLIFITGWSFARKPTWTRAILLGILLGLGGSVKLSPLLLSAPLALFGVMRLVIDRDRSGVDYALKLLAQPVVALTTFVASYPYLWPAPIRRTWNLYAFRASEMEGQSEAWPEVAVASPLDALGRFGRYLTNDRSVTGSIIQFVYDGLGIDHAATGLDYIPAVAGIVILIWWIAKRGFWTPAAMVGLLMGAEAGALVFGMKTDFYRYHLPIVIIMAGCIGIGTGTAWSALSHYLRSREVQTRRVPAAAARTSIQPVRPSTRDTPSRVRTFDAARSREAQQ